MICRLDDGVAAPSANQYGSISPTEPQAVALELGDQCPAIVEGGASSVGVESTIVSCLGERPKILRPGAVGAEEIAEVTGLEVDGFAVKDGEASGGVFEAVVPEVVVPEVVVPEAVVPGQVLSHYAPKTPCVLLAREVMADWVVDWMADWVADWQRTTQAEGLSIRAPSVGLFEV